MPLKKGGSPSVGGKQPDNFYNNITSQVQHPGSNSSYQVESKPCNDNANHRNRRNKAGSGKNNKGSKTDFVYQDANICVKSGLDQQHVSVKEGQVCLYSDKSACEADHYYSNVSAKNLLNINESVCDLNLGTSKDSTKEAPKCQGPNKSTHQVDKYKKIRAKSAYKVDKLAPNGSPDVSQIKSDMKNLALEDITLGKACVSPPQVKAQAPLEVRAQEDSGSNYTDMNLSEEVIARQKDIILSAWPQTTNAAREQFPEFCALYEAIREVGLPNFLGARIPVSSNLVIQKWEDYLKTYHDKELVTFLRFGWPVGFHSKTPPTSVPENHMSAKAYNSHVQRFVAKELDHHAMVGPFKSAPFQPWCRLSPLMTRAKKASSERRVIMDLSFPAGEAPNDGIDISHYFGKDISYSLPSIGDLITKLQAEGRGAFVLKADLSRAYRQLRIDPLDTPLLGLKVDDGIYLDLCPAFGCKSSASACQRMANAVVHIMRNKGHFVLAYLDDFSGCHSDILLADQGYRDFLQLAQELGLSLATQKCVKPSKRIEWLGFDINTNDMTIKIPTEKLREVLNECKKWKARTRANRRMIQSVRGKLIHISACVQQGRKFVSRVLDTRRSMGDRNWTYINDEFLLDLAWFEKYAEVWNGIHLYQPQRPSIFIECDSSKTGAGGNTNGFCYAWEYSAQHTHAFAPIHQLEAVNIVVAYRSLAHLLRMPGARVVIFTDNLASSHVLQSGKTKDKVLASCAREMWLEAAKNDHLIIIEHKPGEELILADALSRRFTDTAKASLADNIIARDNLTVVKPCCNNYVFFTPYL